MKISIEKIDMGAAKRPNHSSTTVGQIVIHEMRWSAPNGTPKRQIAGQSFE
jgi:hypothetical protein